jgi:hypothetical protein
MLSTRRSIEQTPIGLQYVIPGAEKATSASITQRRADAPLRAKVAQKPLGGLFGDDYRQIDLIEEIAKKI